MITRGTIHWINLCSLVLSLIIIIPQGTVGNNLGPDRLEEPKALDPNYCLHHLVFLGSLLLFAIILLLF